MTAFFEKFCLDNQLKSEPILFDFYGRDDVVAFVSKYSGSSFNHGLYRIHSVGQIALWDSVVSAIFPQYRDRIKSVSYTHLTLPTKA